MDILVTNNPMVKTLLKEAYRVEFLDTDLTGILTNVRDKVHKGHRLLTHPLMGSVKPNESPYKTVLVTSKPEAIDTQSVTIIEECIQNVLKFTPKNIPGRYLDDLQMVDLSLIRSIGQK